jgi:prepilin-type N-terminal cleavage/methylation domain-containing protein
MKSYFFKHNFNKNFQKILLFKLTNYTQQGFTLIELLVVVIIVGVLAAVATPNLISQIGKARESEAKSNLGTISRSQQAYHFETQVFANTMQKLTSNVNISSNYYNFPDPSTATDILVQHQAVPINVSKDVARNYASGVYFDPSSSNFNIVICQAQAVNQTVDAPTTATGSCSNGGRIIK